MDPLKARIFQEAVLDTFKAQRFTEVESVVEKSVVPKSGGLARLQNIPLDPIPSQNGLAVGVSQIFSVTRPTDILVRWEVDPATETEPRILAIYGGSQPFGPQTGGLIDIPPSDEVLERPVAIGELRQGPVLSVGSRNVLPGDYTLYFFNDSDSNGIITRSATVSCLCLID